MALLNLVGTARLERRDELTCGAGLLGKGDDIGEVVAEGEQVRLDQGAVVDVPDLAALMKETAVAFEGAAEARRAFSEAVCRFETPFSDIRSS